MVYKTDLYTGKTAKVDVKIRDGEILVLIGLPKTDGDGAFFFNYKHLGKAGY